MLVPIVNFLHWDPGWTLGLARNVFMDWHLEILGFYCRLNRHKRQNKSCLFLWPLDCWIGHPFAWLWFGLQLRGQVRSRRYIPNQLQMLMLRTSFLSCGLAFDMTLSYPAFDDAFNIQHYSSPFPLGLSGSTTNPEVKSWTSCNGKCSIRSQCVLMLLDIGCAKIPLRFCESWVWSLLFMDPCCVWWIHQKR